MKIYKIWGQLWVIFELFLFRKGCCIILSFTFPWNRICTATMNRQFAFPPWFIIVITNFLEKQFDVILYLNPLQCLLTASVMTFLVWVVDAPNCFKTCNALKNAIVTETIIHYQTCQIRIKQCQVILSYLNS